MSLPHLRFALVLALLLPMATAAAASDANLSTDALADKLASWHVPVDCKGLAVGTYDAAGAHARFYGDSGRGQPPDADTIFNIGSVTKTFTAMLLAWADQQGAVRLDDPLELYAPPGIQIPAFHGKKITLAELAYHTSALGRDLYVGGPGLSADTVWTYLNRHRLRRAPGQSYRYSNLGYGVLALALSRQESAPLEALYARVITAPLGMSDTVLQLSAVQSTRLATGYDFHRKRNRQIWAAFPAFDGAAGLHSTLRDMLQYLAFQLGYTPSPLSSLRAAMHAPRQRAEQDIQSGMGWDVRKHRGIEVTSKDGEVPGFGAYIGLALAHGMGTVVLSNEDDCAVEEIGLKLIVNMTRAAEPRLASARRAEGKR